MTESQTDLAPTASPVLVPGDNAQGSSTVVLAHTVPVEPPTRAKTSLGEGSRNPLFEPPILQSPGLGQGAHSSGPCLRVPSARHRDGAEYSPACPSSGRRMLWGRASGSEHKAELAPALHRPISGCMSPMWHNKVIK